MTNNPLTNARGQAIETEPTRANTSRANAQHSTGPRDTTKSRYSALRHGLAGHVILMPGEDLELFEAFHQGMAHDLRPEGTFEQSLVRIIADATWQMERAHAIETNLLFDGAHEKVEELGVSPSVPDYMLEYTLAIARTFEDKIKTIDLMSKYAARHLRQVLQSHTHLRQVQKDRRREQQQRNQERQDRQAESLAHHQKNAVAENANSRITPPGRAEKVTLNPQQTKTQTTNPGFVPPNPKTTSTSPSVAI